MPQPPPELALAIAAATGWRDPPIERADDLPDGPGAYALAIALFGPVPVPVPVSVAGRAGFIAPGAYVYAGSAQGPGGLRARIARHLRSDKPIRWHVDRLTGAPGTCVLAWPAPAGAECDIVERLLATGRFTVPVRGFGSTDCRRCAGHLLAFSG